MKALSGLLAALLLVGCSTTKVWYQVGKSPGETVRQLAKCRKEAQQISNPLAIFNGWAWLANEGDKKNYIKQGMIAEGYSLVNRNSIPDGVRYLEP